MIKYTEIKKMVKYLEKHMGIFRDYISLKMWFI